MTLDEAVKHYGTMYKLFKACGFSVGTPCHWKRRGYIPYPSQMRIEKQTGGALKADTDYITKRVSDELDA